MPRVPRSLTVFPDFAVHKIWRGHNREWNLGTADEKRQYLRLLYEAQSKQPRNSLQAITLMSNHSHEVYLIQDPKNFSNQMRWHHSKYGVFFNRKHERCGKVAQDRPKTCLIENDEYSMRAVFYIHANPVRANMVKDAKDYPWSTHLFYAFGKTWPWITIKNLPDWYIRLGNTATERQRRYRQLFNKYLIEVGLRRLDFVTKRFYGNVFWMIEMEQPVQAWYKSHSPPR
jgi:putative transposase